VSVLGGGAGVRRGVFLHDSRGASLTLASIAVTAYTGSQTVGPLVGDRLTLRYGRTSLFRAEGLLSTAGLAIAVASPHPALSLGGFAICGLGSSVLLPLTFSAAGHARGVGGVPVAVHHLHLRGHPARPRIRSAGWRSWSG
jgi:MFS family permease